MKSKVLSVRRYGAGYEIRTESQSLGDGDPFPIKSAYTIPEGHYIGESKWAHRLIVKRGIKPELIGPGGNVCCIGFCEREQKWYGWSHRAMFGFGVGDTVKEGDCCAVSGWTDEYLAEHPDEDTSLPIGFKAKTLADCKKMAVAFAESVG